MPNFHAAPAFQAADLYKLLEVLSSLPKTKDYIQEIKDGEATLLALQDEIKEELKKLEAKSLEVFKENETFGKLQAERADALASKALELLNREKEVAVAEVELNEAYTVLNHQSDQFTEKQAALNAERIAFDKESKLARDELINAHYKLDQREKALVEREAEHEKIVAAFKKALGNAQAV